MTLGGPAVPGKDGGCPSLQSLSLFGEAETQHRPRQGPGHWQGLALPARLQGSGGVGHLPRAALLKPPRLS